MALYSRGGGVTKSLWSDWSVIASQITRAEQVALFLDYDGTLTPITTHPSRAILKQRTRNLLQILARQKNVFLALVSGRSLKELKQMVRVKSVCYVGNHGLEIQGGGIQWTHPELQSSRPVVRSLLGRLRTALRSIPGAWVENKGATLSVHTRQVAVSRLAEVKSRFEAVIADDRKAKKIRVTTGKRVLEVRPSVRWNKGDAVRRLLAEENKRSAKAKQFILYVGDDRTDEDAFRVLNRRAVTVLVGGRQTTRARYRVRSSADVHRLLERILTTWNEEAGSALS